MYVSYRDLQLGKKCGWAGKLVLDKNEEHICLLTDPGDALTPVDEGSKEVFETLNGALKALKKYKSKGKPKMIAIWHECFCELIRYILLFRC
jgi:hypothetical protein